MTDLKIANSVCNSYLLPFTQTRGRQSPCQMLILWIFQIIFQVRHKFIPSEWFWTLTWLSSGEIVRKQHWGILLNVLLRTKVEGKSQLWNTLQTHALWHHGCHGDFSNNYQPSLPCASFFNFPCVLLWHQFVTTDLGGIWSPNDTGTFQSPDLNF